MGNVKIISASAGSGKTYRLAYEYVRSVIRDPMLYRHILAVTFTNKATEEMRSRILERLHELASDVPSPYMADLMRDLSFDEKKIIDRAAEAQKLILHDYSRFAVLTIDRFFQRLIRSFIRELGIEVNFNLELETDSLLSLAADALIEDAALNEDLRSRLFIAARDRIDENKHRDIKEPLLDLGRELFGEEYRRASDDASSLIESVIVRAREAQNRFTEVVREMQRVIVAHGLGVNDFKGKSKGLVPWLAKAAAGDFAPLSNYVRQDLEGDTLPPELKLRLAELDAMYNTHRRLVSSARLLRENHHNFLLLADLQQRVEQICAKENIMPIAETNRVIARLVEGNDTPFIFEKAGTYFSRFLIDEFQDTSSAQWDNFVPLLKNAIASEPGEPVMLIGDIKQAIYRWRGGDWQILSRRVRDRMGEDRVEKETLDTNYRSLRRVVEFNNRAVGLVVEAGNTALNGLVAGALAEGAIETAEAAELTDMLAEAYKDHTQKSKSDADEGYVTLTLYGANDAGEWIPPVVERIEELQSRGYRAGDIAVLVRSNTQGARVARMLLERKHENPDSPYCYDVVTAEALTVGASAVSRFIIACLSLAADPDDSIQRAVFNRWLGLDLGKSLDDDSFAFFSRLAILSPEEAFEETVLRFELQERVADVAYIQAVHQQITAFLSRSVADIPLFLKWWNEKGASASITMQGSGGSNGTCGDSDGEAITVSTIHKSKGLQYKVVIVPYLSWTMGPDTRGRQLVVWADATEEGLAGVGALPINYKESMSGSFFSVRYYREQVLAHIDAMNLLYVALTRAEAELHLMSSTNPRDGRGSAGNVLRTVLDIENDFTEWGSPLFHMPLFPRCEADSNGDAALSATGALRSYPTSRPGTKVRLRLPSSRYFEDFEGGDGGDSSATVVKNATNVTLSPRSYGVLMHRAFENAAETVDVQKAIDRMLNDGYISREEYASLQTTVSESLAEPLVAEWFDGEWDAVHNEGDILLPRRGGATAGGVSSTAVVGASGTSADGPITAASDDATTAYVSASVSATRRPDRVMIRGTKAVIVDYKFGNTERPEYTTQLRDYVTLLRRMGYTDVEAYLWYVSQGKIERVK